MARAFQQATAEQIAAVVSAVVAKQNCQEDFVEKFTELPEAQVKKALDLAVDLRLLTVRAARKYSIDSPIALFMAFPNVDQKAAVLRIALESYEPFLVFRQQLSATGSAGEAAKQTKAILELDLHHEEVKDTLLSLGTFAKALRSEGGGRFSSSDSPLENTLAALADACKDQTSAEAQIRVELGGDACTVVSYDEVIKPLATALIQATGKDAREAVLNAGNAVESFLVGLASRTGADITRASGINSKLDRLKQHKVLPTKIQNMGYYLGHIRNAADHGIDPDVGAAWEIRENTGLQFVYIAASFIAVAIARENRVNPPQV